MSGFAENAFLGRRLKIGTKAVIAVTDRDPRCKMITLDPNTAHASPEVLRRVRDSHGARRASMVPCSSRGLFGQETRSDFWTSD